MTQAQVVLQHRDNSQIAIHLSGDRPRVLHRILVVSAWSALHPTPSVPRLKCARHANCACEENRCRSPLLSNEATNCLISWRLRRFRTVTFDGYALLKEFRGLAPAVGGIVPVIAITAQVTAKSRAQAIDAGFDSPRLFPT